MTWSSSVLMHLSQTHYQLPYTLLLGLLKFRMKYPNEHSNVVQDHGKLNGDGLYQMFYAWATERPWTSLIE